ncbi:MULTISPECIES: condensation domain-containing protein [unclassified Streptomyces]|uniref:condensation domain-containing protein n=1 Tax=unclassified Streptomyces TaxID=2593676 RepID=UPI002E2A164D|nr:condensation domain-containing protein [Streptomyces sp. NBC_00223]
MSSRNVTRGQDGLWRIDRGHGDGPLPSWMLLRLTVEFDTSSAVVTAADALTQVMERHEGLRTTIEVDPAGSPVQTVHEDARLDVETVETDADGFDEAKSALLDRLSGPRFDLSRHYPVRAGLVDCGERQALVLLIHHIAADRWSLRVLHDELLEAVTRGRVDWQHPMQPGDVAERESSQEGKRRNELALRYLEQCHEKAPQCLFMESEGDDGPQFTSTWLHSPAAYSAARKIASRYGVSEPAIWLSALSSYLSLTSGLDGCRFHMQVSNRTDKAEHTVVARMARSVPVAVDLSGDPAFSQVAQRSLRATVGAMRNANFSNRQYEEIVRSAQRRRGVHFRDQVFVNYLPGLPSDSRADDDPDRISGVAFTRRTDSGPTFEFSVVSEKEGVVLAVDRRYVKDPEGAVHWVESTLCHLVEVGDVPLSALPGPTRTRPTAELTRYENSWVSLPEIAAALNSHPAVASAEVSVRRDDGAETLVARVHLERGDVPPEELRAYMAESLPRRSTLMVPKEFIVRPGAAE